LKTQSILSAIGGDGRQFYITELFSKDGYQIRRYGISENSDNCKSLDAALEGAEYLLLPLPLTKDGCKLNSEKDILISELIKSIPAGCKVFAGKIPPHIKDLFSSFGVNYTDYLENKSYVWKNADITAEGAVYQLMSELDISLRESNILICGYGRIGKLLASKLKSLGAHVTVAARKEDDLMLADIFGGNNCDKLDYCRDGIFNLKKSYDAIFNTVPSWIFDENNSSLLKNSVYIELASPPFGGDGEFMKKNCGKYILASGIPGKYAPRSAANAVFEALRDCLSKGG